MIATSHALISGAIIVSATNPVVGLGLSFISHPFLDLIPHWDFCYNWRKKSRLRLFVETCLDFGIGVSIAYILFGQKVEIWYFLLAIFLAEVWDIAEAPYWFLKWNFFPFSTIYNIQHRMQNKLDLPWGLFTQVATVAAVILLFQYIGQF